MNGNDIQKKAVAAMTGKTKKVTMRVNRLTWLHRLKLRPKERGFQIGHLSPGNLMRISGLLLEIGFDANKPDAWREALRCMHQSMPDLIKICAIGISNCKEEPPEKLLEFITNDTDYPSVFNVFVAITSSLEIKSFMTSITLIKGVSLLNQGS